MACVCVFVRLVCARVWLSMSDICGGGGRMPEEVGREGGGWVEDWRQGTRDNQEERIDCGGGGWAPLSLFPW